MPAEGLQVYQREPARQLSPGVGNAGDGFMSQVVDVLAPV